MKKPTWTQATETNNEGVFEAQRTAYKDTSFTLFQYADGVWGVSKFESGDRVLSTSFADESEARGWVEEQIAFLIRNGY